MPNVPPSCSPWHPFQGADEASWRRNVLARLEDAPALRALVAGVCAPRSPAEGGELLLQSVRTFKVQIGPFIDRQAAVEESGGEQEEEGEALTWDAAVEDCSAVAAAPVWYEDPGFRELAWRSIELATGWKRKAKGGDLFIVVHVDSAPGESAPCGSFRITVRLSGYLWRRLSKAHCRSSFTVPPSILAARTEQVVRYDRALFDFPLLMARLLEVADLNDRPEEALARLHELPLQKPPLFPALSRAHKQAGLAVPPELRGFDSSSQERLEASEQWRSFLGAFRRFAHEVCAPLCGCEQLVFQCPPTVRIVLPGAPATIGLHCDGEYPRHWKGEVNFWLPLTEVGGSNSMWLETEPGKGDFRPLELGPGEVLRFNGYECRHYTVANESPTCRVSFDWRAIPAELCRGLPIEAIGDYPAELTGP